MDPNIWRLADARSPYRLYEARETAWSLVEHMQNGNGIDMTGDGPLVWLGNGNLEITVLASDNGAVDLRGDLLMGPSLPGKPTRDLLLQSANSFKTTVVLGAGHFSVAVPVNKGRNIVTITDLDKASLRSLPNGDSRTLLAGLTHLDVVFENKDKQETLAFEVENRYREETPSEPFFWMSSVPSRVTFQKKGAGQVRVNFGYQPGPSVTGGSARRVRVSLGSYSKEVVLTKPKEEFLVSAADGQNRLRLLALDKATIGKQPNGDTRELIVGVRDLKLTAVRSNGRK